MCMLDVYLEHCSENRKAIRYAFESTSTLQPLLGQLNSLSLQLNFTPTLQHLFLYFTTHIFLHFATRV